MRYQSFLFRTVKRELFQTKVGLRKQRKVYHGILQTLEMSRKKPWYLPLAIEIEFLFDEILIRKLGKKEEKIRLGACPRSISHSAPASKETSGKRRGK